MVLTFEQIKAATTGAVAVTQERDGIHFSRMHPQQVQAAREQEEAFFTRAQATSGVKLTFRTDSPRLTLDVNVINTGVRAYYALDVCVNGRLVGSLDNYSHVEDIHLTRYAEVPFENSGSNAGCFELGEGEKTVCIHLPWSKVCTIRELSLVEGASFVPAPPEKKILFFGDSITQGYDALHPSQSYASRISAALGMAEYNKGIGGITFCPGIAEVKETFVPDAIVVAYGTNDWSKIPTVELFRERCCQMYRAIFNHYPNTPVFALGPILQRSSNGCRRMGAFCKVGQIIEEVVADIPNTSFIDCLTFLPWSAHYYADRSVHPNDRGFEYYCKGLLPRMKAVLEGGCL